MTTTDSSLPVTVRNKLLIVSYSFFWHMGNSDLDNLIAYLDVAYLIYYLQIRLWLYLRMVAMHPTAICYCWALLLLLQYIAYFCYILEGTYEFLYFFWGPVSISKYLFIFLFQQLISPPQKSSQNKIYLVCIYIMKHNRTNIYIKMCP